MSAWYERKVPVYYITIKGLEINPELITRVSTEDTENQASSASITIKDPPRAIISKYLSFYGSEVVVEGGWKEDSTSRWFTGVVSSMEMGFSRDHKISITFNCTDRSTILEATSERSWTESTDAEAVDDILSSYGLLANVRETPVRHESLSKPTGVRDVDFIFERASMNPGFVFWVDGNEAYFGPRDTSSTSEKTLVYGTDPWNLLEFTVTYDPPLEESYGVAEIEDDVGVVVERDSEQQPPRSAQREVGSGSIQYKDSSELNFDSSGVRAAPAPRPSTSEEEFNHLEAIRVQEESVALSGIGSCLPNPSFKAKTNIVLAGLGEELSGKWYVSMVRNTIGKNGWTQRFEVIRPEDIQPMSEPIPSTIEGEPSSDSSGSTIWDASREVGKGTVTYDQRILGEE